MLLSLTTIQCSLPGGCHLSRAGFSALLGCCKEFPLWLFHCFPSIWIYLDAISIIAPGRCAARMPGTGPLRRSSVPARKKAIVGKSRVAPDRLQRPSFCLSDFGNVGFTFSDLHGKESLTKSNGKLGRRQFPSDRRILPFFGDVAQRQLDQLSGCLIARKMAPGFEHLA
jgi:hypothetical protein